MMRNLRCCPFENQAKLQIVVLAQIDRKHHRFRRSAATMIVGMSHRRKRHSQDDQSMHHEKARNPGNNVHNDPKYAMAEKLKPGQEAPSFIPPENEKSHRSGGF